MRLYEYRPAPLVTVEQVSCIYFANHIVKAVVIAVGNDGVALLLKFSKVDYDFTAEKGGFILQRGFVNDDVCTFRFDTFHDTLNRTLSEIVRITFHSESVDTYGHLLFVGLIIGVW